MDLFDYGIINTKAYPENNKKRDTETVFYSSKNKKSSKIFAIGNNKTGTTSLKVAIEDLGFIIGEQRPAELMHHHWAKRDFKPLIEFCKTAEFFQDFPFSKPFTFIALDQAFPNSKFILTVRDSPEQWDNSVTKFHAKLWGKNGRIPTKEDLMEAPYIYKGFAWEMKLYMNITPENDLYQKDLLIKSYIDYNESVIKYFEHRPENLLVINLSDKGAYRALCDFLGVKSNKEDFPWENKTATLKQRK